MEHQPTPPLYQMSSSSSEDKPDDEDASIDSSDEEMEEEAEEETEEDKQSTNLSPYHAQNYFNSTMGGKDLQVLFAMVVSCSSREFPDHKDPPFLKSKCYQSKVKPDTATLKLEVKWHWKAYFSTTRQPHPTNWKIDKCHEYLPSHPIPISKKAYLDFLESEIEEWKGIQLMINESQEQEDNQIIHHSWSSNIPYLHLYHTLVEDSIQSAFGKVYNAKTREELDGRNTSLFEDFYKLAAEQFNNANWISNSLFLPDLHENFSRSKPLPLNVTPITAEQFKKITWQQV